MRTLHAVAFLFAGLQAAQSGTPKKETGTMKITPLICVPAIDPSLKFWGDDWDSRKPSKFRMETSSVL